MITITSERAHALDPSVQHVTHGETEELMWCVRQTVNKIIKRLPWPYIAVAEKSDVSLAQSAVQYYVKMRRFGGSWAQRMGVLRPVIYA